MKGLSIFFYFLGAVSVLLLANVFWLQQALTHRQQVNTYPDSELIRQTIERDFVRWDSLALTLLDRKSPQAVFLAFDEAGLERPFSITGFSNGVPSFWQGPYIRGSHHSEFVFGSGGVYRTLSFTLPQLPSRRLDLAWLLESRVDGVSAGYRSSLETLFPSFEFHFLPLALQTFVLRVDLDENLALFLKPLASRRSFPWLGFGSLSLLLLVLFALAFPLTSDWYSLPAERMLLTRLLYLATWFLLGQFADFLGFWDLMLAGYSSDSVWSELPYLLNIALLAFAGLAFVRFLFLQRRLYGIQWYPRTIVFSVGFGLLSGWAWSILPEFFVPQNLRFELFMESGSLFPDLQSIALLDLFFVELMTLFGVSIFMARFLLGSESEQVDWVYPLVVTGFIISFTGLIFVYQTSIPLWTTLVKSLGFLMSLLVAHLIFRGFRLPSYFTRLRLALFIAFVVTLCSYPFLWQFHLQKQQKRIETSVHAFMRTEPVFTQTRVQNLIDFSSTYSFENEASITELSQRLLPQALFLWERGADRHRHLFAIQKRDSLALLTPLSTDLLAKLVSLQFSIPEAASLTPLVDENEALIGYHARIRRRDIQFHMASVVPLFSDKQGLFTPTVRAVALYKDGLLQRRFLNSQHSSFEIPSRINERTSRPNRGLLLISYPNDQMVAVWTTELHVSDHIFQWVRLLLFYAIVSIGIYGLFLLSFWKRPELLRLRQSLQFRLIDSLIIAGLLFLISLIGITQFSVSRFLDQEKQRIIRAEINNKNSEKNPISLALTYFDAQSGLELYEGLEHVSPERQRLSVDLLQAVKGAQDILFLPENGQISAYVNPDKDARGRLIKARLNSSLQQTTRRYFSAASVLILFYVGIFAVFVIAAGFITRHLTLPLTELARGLRKVAQGDFGATVIPRSKDEVGDLANAYNVMLFRLKDLQAELAHAEREAAWSDMARQVAHEIKNPLTPMKLSIQHLQHQVMAGKRSPKELQRSVDDICGRVIEQIESLNLIASDFSKFARSNREHFTLVDVNALIINLVKLYEHDRNLHVSLDLHPKTLAFLGLKEDISRVLINLIKNADEAMPYGGVIVIRTYPYHDQIYIELADNGTGIAIHEQENIFHPNFSTKTKGSGLGLAICKKIMESHDGEISFASVPGAGTTFTLAFPSKKSDASLEDH